MSEKIASQLIGSDFFLVSDIVGGRFDDSPVPAYAFFFFFFLVDIRSRTPTTLFRSGSVHSGSAS